jgi:putative addiction module CopG family antidote
MNVSLSEYWEKFIGQQIATGQYGNSSEVIREALRYWRDERERKAMEEFRGVWPQEGPAGEPSDKDQAQISAFVRAHRRAKRARR